MFCGKGGLGHSTGSQDGWLPPHVPRKNMMRCDIFCLLALFWFERLELTSLRNCDYKGPQQLNGQEGDVQDDVRPDERQVRLAEPLSTSPGEHLVFVISLGQL